MPLGDDSTEFCGPAFAEAMRPIAGDNVDLEAVRNNLNALGEAVYQLATTHAEPYSDANLDAAFWAWAGTLQTCVAGLLAWQAGVTAAVTAWTPATPPEQGLKSALVAIPAPKPAP